MKAKKSSATKVDVRKELLVGNSMEKESPCCMGPVSKIQ